MFRNLWVLLFEPLQSLFRTMSVQGFQSTGETLGCDLFLGDNAFKYIFFFCLRYLRIQIFFLTKNVVFSNLKVLVKYIDRADSFLRCFA